MSFVDSERAGKRLVVWLDGNGGCTKVRPLPPQTDDKSFIEATAGGHVIHAGKAIKLGYLTYNELCKMYPKFAASQVTGRANEETENTRKRKGTYERTYTVRWGLTNTLFPQWQPLNDKGKMKEHTKDYLYVEERRTTFQVTADDDGQELLLNCVSQVTRPYKPRTTL